jgi:hypothetical protein
VYQPIDFDLVDVIKARVHSGRLLGALTAPAFASRGERRDRALQTRRGRRFAATDEPRCAK